MAVKIGLTDESRHFCHMRDKKASGATTHLLSTFKVLWAQSLQNMANRKGAHLP